MTGESVKDARAQLLQRFNKPFSEHGNQWDQMWKQGTFLPWDKGRPSPALEDLLNDPKSRLPQPVAGDGTRRRVLVPGCGRGYDVLLFAAHGYEAYGLEISEDAVKACDQLAATEWLTKYAVGASPHGIGTYQFVNADFFSHSWQEDTATQDGFDLVYDYTFLSALPPELRPAWSKRMVQLLRPRPDSRLITLEFPTAKDPSTGGPPWALRPDVYLAHLTRPGETIPYKSDRYPDESSYTPLQENSTASSNGLGLIRTSHWQPERTHEIGKGTDWIGVWKRPAES